MLSDCIITDMSKITDDEVKRLAVLARIGLSDDEVRRLAGELDQIVGFVKKLQAVTTKDVPPTSQVTGLIDVWRADESKPSPVSQTDLLQNAVETQDGYIKVRRVL